MKKPGWSEPNLERHYNKHPVGDNECWPDLLGKPLGKVTREDYRSASLRIIDHPWLEFLADYQETYLVEYQKRRYFVDKLQCLTVVNFSGESIITCFHDHPVQDCHELLVGETGQIEFLKHWCKKKKSGKIKIQRPSDVKPKLNSTTWKRLKTYLAEFQSTVRSQGR